MTSFFISFFLLKKLKLLNRILVSVAIPILGMNSYEIIWILLVGHNPIAYVLSTLIVLLIITAYNVKGKFLHFNKVFFCLVILQIFVFSYLYFSGWFKLVNLWFFQGIGTDPHNWIWLLNKGLADWILIVLLIPKNISRFFIKKYRDISVRNMGSFK